MDALNPITIKPIRTLKDNYVWVIINNASHTAVIIDPGEADPVITFLNDNKLSLLAVLITHHHWDHTNGIPGIINHSDVPIYGPAAEKIPSVTNIVFENIQIDIPGFPTLQALDIPGHTIGHIAYYSPGILFCGDTLFAAGCGRIFEGTAAQMYSSLQKIAALPEDTKIYCAHEYTLNNLRFAATVEPSNKKINERIQSVTELRHKNLPSLPSTLREEKETNPFLRCHEPELRIHAEEHIGQTLTTPIAIFTALRQWKNNF
ncbi:MAG: hydroxyacylglutathione hydrolase [Gammaproteobacteria bacterium]|nr:hydroxyacylglutathione hydrolase [Gammaproteobacteria bacterium]MCW5582363.1 hydroxyacylglutathione hydrolase [Gammaproteobacteria bacterium]